MRDLKVQYFNVLNYVKVQQYTTNEMKCKEDYALSLNRIKRIAHRWAIQKVGNRLGIDPQGLFLTLAGLPHLFSPILIFNFGGHHNGGRHARRPRSARHPGGGGPAGVSPPLLCPGGRVRARSKAGGLAEAARASGVLEGARKGPLCI